MQTRICLPRVSKNERWRFSGRHHFTLLRKRMPSSDQSAASFSFFSSFSLPTKRRRSVLAYFEKWPTFLPKAFFHGKYGSLEVSISVNISAIKIIASRRSAEKIFGKNEDGNKARNMLGKNQATLFTHLLRLSRVLLVADGEKEKSNLSLRRPRISQKPQNTTSAFEPPLVRLWWSRKNNNFCPRQSAEQPRKSLFCSLCRHSIADSH